MKKLFRIFILFAALPLCAFDWPQMQEVMSDSFYSYFGQLRGGTISNSLVFSEPSEIKAADSGYLTVVMREFSDDTDFFPSTLGNAVIIAHQDNLLTVYGNIDSASISDSIYDMKEVESGTKFGYSGNSAWQQGHSSLEFQVIDTKNNTAINPRILMPRIGKELPLYFSGVILQNKNGRKFDIQSQKVLQAGTYRIYQKKHAVAMPYKTRVAINGTTIDEISYDLLRQENGLICVSGKKNYTKDVLYPNVQQQLLGEVTLTPGHNAMTISLTDILGKETTASYNLNIY